MFVFFRAIITSQQWFHIDAWLSVLDKVLMIILVGGMLYLPYLAGSISIDRFLLLQIFCTAAANVLTLLILLRKRFFFSFKRLWPQRYVFRTALPFAIILLLMAFHSRIDGFLLERIIGSEEAGKYAASYRLLDASNTVGYLFASFLLPFLSKAWVEKRNINEVSLGVRHILMLLAICVSTITVFLAPWIQQLLYHNSNPDYIIVLQWCLPALFGYSLIQVYGTVLSASGRVHIFSQIMLVAVIINLILNLVLIPRYGAVGSCISALSSQVLAGIITMTYTIRKLSMKFHLRSWLIYIFIAISLCAFLYSMELMDVNEWMSVIGAGSIALLLGFFTGLIDIKTWKKSVQDN
jgi:O-antigen/teichoic acid export membrane protein